MPRNKLRRVHVAIDPPVTAKIHDRRVTFLGVNLLTGVVMVEYDVEPPLDAGPFGPHLLVLDVTDDVSDEVYPTAWEDFQWPGRAPGRTTTRLNRRPPAEAHRLHVEVRQVGRAGPQAPEPHSAGEAVARFDVQLPPEHGSPWQSVREA
jgi:hypothetical protein